MKELFTRTTTRIRTQYADTLGWHSFLVVLSALLLVASFNVTPLWPLGLVSLIPLFFVLHRNISKKRAFGYSTLFGALYMAGVLSWYWSTFPLDWAGIESSGVAFILIVCIWMIESIAGGLLFGLWGIGAHLISRRNLILYIVGSPVLWVVVEYGRAWMVTLLWSGQDTPLGPHWSIGSVGYLFAEQPFLLSYASVGGIYLLSFILVFMNATLFALLKARAAAITRTAYAGILIFSIVTGGTVLYISHTPTSAERFTVALLQTNIPSGFTTSEENLKQRFNSQLALLADVRHIDLQENIDIVVFPEDSRFSATFENGDDSGPRDFFKKTLGDDTLVIDSGRIDTEKGAVSRVSYIQPGKETSYGQKSFLMPFGEYMPRVVYAGARLLGLDEWVEEFSKNRSYRSGTPSDPAMIDNTPIGTLACSEAMSPQLYPDLASKNTDVFVNIASQAAFQGSPILAKQQRNVAQVRAVEANRYYIQATNFQSSMIINNHGVVTQKGVAKKDAVVFGHVIPITKPSLYTQLLSH